MKKIIILTALACVCFGAFAADTAFKPAGKVSVFTETDFAVTTKFGEYFRTPQTKKVHIFNADGLETEISTYNAKDQLIEKLTFKYDISRNLTDVILTDENQKEIITTTTEYKNGKITSISEYDANKKLNGKTIYKYDGTKTTISYYDGNGALLSKNISTADETGKTIEECEYYADGSLTEKSVFSYTNDKISQIDITKDGRATKKIYRYDNNGNVSEIQTYNNSSVLIERTIYKNDENGNPVTIRDYEVSEKFGATANELQEIKEIIYKYSGEYNSK